MPPRPRTDSIRNPAISVPIRVEAPISRGPAIIRPSPRGNRGSVRGAARGPSTPDARAGARLPSDLEELVLAGEDRRDGLVAEDVHDRLREQPGDREHVDLLRTVDRVDRDRVRD